jgi:predicted amidohydrolase
MKILVGVGQMTSTNEKNVNLDYAESIIESASRYGAKLVSLPENFAYMGANAAEAINIAEDLCGPTINRLQKNAKKNRIWVSLGGFQEKIPGKDKIYNTHILLDDAGNIIAIYRKIHLFSLTMSPNNIYDEARFVEAGHEVVVASSPFFVAGLAICYDLRFPNLFSLLRKQGAQVMLVPSAFTQITGQAHWEILLRARAIETQSYVMAAAQVGRHQDDRHTYGHAMIVDPWGSVIGQCGDNMNLTLAEVDLGYLEKIRKNMPIKSLI